MAPVWARLRGFVVGVVAAALSTLLVERTHHLVGYLIAVCLGPMLYFGNLDRTCAPRLRFATEVRVGDDDWGHGTLRRLGGPGDRHKSVGVGAANYTPGVSEHRGDGYVGLCPLPWNHGGIGGGGPNSGGGEAIEDKMEKGDAGEGLPDNYDQKDDNSSRSLLKRELGKYGNHDD